MAEILNAQITGTFLGMEHGCLTADVFVDTGIWQCAYGGYCLEHWECTPGEYKSHHGLGAIIELMKTLEVTKWEDLKGKYIRVETGSGWGSGITRIGHLMKDKWFSFEDYYKICKEEDE